MPSSSIIQSALETLLTGGHLPSMTMERVMEAVMGGDASPAQIAGVMIALRIKGETPTEIAAAARVMRRLATHVKVTKGPLVDTCGTGGDGARLFNVSTASALVVSAAGAYVAKHGNRSVSSSSGSADVLEAAQVNLNLTADQVGRCVDEVGIGFLFAPRHHGAMRHAIEPRRDLGVRTLFNLLGPLTNPADALRQVLGVYDARWVQPMAQVLRELGSEHVLVVHGEDGLDEISLAAPTLVAELQGGAIHRYTVTPEELGVARQALAPLQVDDTAASLALLRAALAGEPGPARDIVALNAGAAIYVAGLAEDLRTGVARAQEIMASGAAQARLAELVAWTNQDHPRAPAAGAAP